MKESEKQNLTIIPQQDSEVSLACSRKGGRNLHGREILKQNCMIGECYCVVRLLGKGGEGDVYLVRHLVTGQLRAAKLLGAGIGSQSIRSGLPATGYAGGNSLHELYMLKQLHHPSLPRIIDVLEEEERIWLIMEYIRGTPLMPLAHSEVKANQFFSTAEQLAEVLVYLHTRPSPVLHLDIKPGNILIRPDGSLALIDFGTAIESKYGETGQQHFGTKGFAAPEQEQENGSADIRSDIYGFGAVMHYYLFGVPPEKAGEKKRKRKKKSERKTDKRILGQKIAWIKKDDRSISYWRFSAKRMIFRCLKTSKEERFQSSIQLLHTIRRQKRWYHVRKYAVKMLVTFSLFVIVVLFSVRQMAAEYKNNVDTEAERYEVLLETSERLGFFEACACYEEAAGIYPADFGWAEQFVDRILEDYLFEAEEEKEWNKLFFGTTAGDGRTAKELLAENEAEYGPLAYQMGIAYWYYYEEAGGKYAAYKWFLEALHCAEAVETSPKWHDAARIYTKIGGYYEKMGKTGAGEEQLEVSVQTYWTDLTALWELELSKYESEVVRCQIVEELLACVILRGYELAGSKGQETAKMESQEAEGIQGQETEKMEKETQDTCMEQGIKLEEMSQMILSIREFLEQEVIEEDREEALIQQCDEAEKTIMRMKKALE